MINMDWRTLSQQMWFNRLLMALCVFFIILFFYQITVVMDAYHFIYQPVKTELPVTTKEKSVSKKDWSSLFGTYVPPELDESSIRKSMLNLEISGIMYDEDPDKSYVTIRDATKEEKTWHVGSLLPGGIKIRKISQESILIEHNGGLERLTFPHQELEFLPMAKPPVNGALDE